MCLSEKYGNIKIKDFYEKNSQDLQSLIVRKILEFNPNCYKITFREFFDIKFFLNLLFFSKDCQVKVMNLANSEKESIPSEKVLHAQFNEDYM